MKFKKLKNSAQQLLQRYESQDPATYAAAEQAIGGLLILDGFVGIDNPFGGKKRPGIFGSLIGIVVGVVFLFVPVIFNAVSGVNKLTATTTATIISVHQDQIRSTNTANGNTTNSTTSNSCSAVASYTVNGRQYQQASSFSSSNTCGLAQGSTITISYNPNNPGSWGYDVQSVEKIIKIFPIVGVLAILASLVTFLIRLASIIFGWKLLKSGRARAKTLPQGTNVGAMIEQIKQEFKANIFHSGGGINPLAQTLSSLSQGTTPVAATAAPAIPITPTAVATNPAPVQSIQNPAQPGATPDQNNLQPPQQ